jgi:transketolase
MTAVPVAAARSSREAYRDWIAAVLPADPRLVCLDSDTGLFTGVDFGDGASRYFNLGIAEQNLMGVAAGLASCGRIPFVNTMATFASTRALEAVKIDIALNNLPVRIVATHGGLSAGHLGPTHHSLEDLAIMRLLPNMTVVVPADPADAEELLRQCLDLPGPVYLRLDRGAVPGLPACPPVELGRAQLLRYGGSVTLAACGAYPVRAAVEAAETLASAGVSATVLNLHTVKPLDVAAVTDAAARTGLVVTVEEHWSAGGLGSAIAETLAELAVARVFRIAVADEFVTCAGDQRYLLARTGITAAAIVARAWAAVGAPGAPPTRPPDRRACPAAT